MSVSVCTPESIDLLETTSRCLREEWRPGRVGLVLEDGYLMQRVPPVINLAAAQGLLASPRRPPIYQRCQRTTDGVDDRLLPFVHYLKSLLDAALYLTFALHQHQSNLIFI